MPSYTLDTFWHEYIMFYFYNTVSYVVILSFCTELKCVNYWCDVLKWRCINVSQRGDGFCVFFLLLRIAWNPVRVSNCQTVRQAFWCPDLKLTTDELWFQLLLDVVKLISWWKDLVGTFRCLWISRSAKYFWLCILEFGDASTSNSLKVSKPCLSWRNGPYLCTTSIFCIYIE